MHENVVISLGLPCLPRKYGEMLGKLPFVALKIEWFAVKNRLEQRKRKEPKEKEMFIDIVLFIVHLLVYVWICWPMNIFFDPLFFYLLRAVLTNNEWILNILCLFVIFVYILIYLTMIILWPPIFLSFTHGLK